MSCPFLSRRLFLGGLAASVLAAGGLPAFAQEQPAQGGTDAAVHVLAATYPAYLACAVLLQGNQKFAVDLLVSQGTGCPHDYAMTPQDRIKLEEAKVLVLVGGGYEPFLDDKILKGLSCTVLDGAKLCAGKLAEAGQDPLLKGNPHYFASPRLFAGLVLALADALGKLHPDCAAEAAERSRAFSGRMEALANELCSLGEKNVHLVLQHDTLAWFFKETKCSLETVLQEDDGEAPSAAMLLSLSSTIKSAQEKGERYLLAGEPQFSGSVLDMLVKETGARKIVLDPLVSGVMPVPDGFYEKVMQDNVQKVRQALAK